MGGNCPNYKGYSTLRSTASTFILYMYMYTAHKLSFIPQIRIGCTPR